MILLNAIRLHRSRHRLGLGLIGGALSGCQGRVAPESPVAQPLRAECADGRFKHSLALIPASDTTNPSVVRGRLLVANDSKPLAEAYVALRSPSGARTGMTDTSGRFAIGRVPPGRYELLIRRIGYDNSSDSIDVPLRGQTIESRQSQSRSDPFGCVFPRALASEPPLTLARSVSITRDFALPDSGLLRHTATFLANADLLEVESRLTNIGTMPLVIFQTPHTSLEGKPVRLPPLPEGDVVFTIPGAVIRPGQSVEFRYAGRLRGAPGRYVVTVHAAEGKIADIQAELSLIRATKVLPFR